MTKQAQTGSQLRQGFHLGAWQIWPNAGQIEKDGLKCHIEPKLVEVLLLLAASPGQVISRDELLDHAWHRQVVCDEALTRAISELRTLLGDTGRERHYIRTVPKRGYALIADVVPMADKANFAGGQNSQSTAPSRKTRQPRAFFRYTPSLPWISRLIKYWLYGVGSLTTGFAALCIVFVLSNVGVELEVVHGASMLYSTEDAIDMKLDKQMDELIPASSFPSLKSFAVLPLTNLTPDQDLGFFTQGLEEDIRAALSLLHNTKIAGRLASNQYQGFNNENGNTNKDNAAGASVVQNIAAQLKVDALLDGTVRLIDGKVRVTLQLLDGESGFPLWSKRYDNNFEALLKLQTLIAEDVHCELESRLPKPALLAAMVKPKKPKDDTYTKHEDYGHTRHIEWLAR